MDAGAASWLQTRAEEDGTADDATDAAAEEMKPTVVNGTIMMVSDYYLLLVIWNDELVS